VCAFDSAAHSPALPNPGSLWQARLRIFPPIHFSHRGTFFVAVAPSFSSRSWYLFIGNFFSDFFDTGGYWTFRVKFEEGLGRWWHNVSIAFTDSCFVYFSVYSKSFQQLATVMM
jgi:hypothetical protein